MGRAIDMEKDIDELKGKVKKINNIIRGIIKEIDDIAEVIEDNSGKVKEEKKDGKKQANTKGNGKSDKSSDTADRDADAKSK